MLSFLRNLVQSYQQGNSLIQQLNNVVSQASGGGGTSNDVFDIQGYDEHGNPIYSPLKDYVSWGQTWLANAAPGQSITQTHIPYGRARNSPQIAYAKQYNEDMVYGVKQRYDDSYRKLLDRFAEERERVHKFNDLVSGTGRRAFPGSSMYEEQIMGLGLSPGGAKVTMREEPGYPLYEPDIPEPMDIPSPDYGLFNQRLQAAPPKRQRSARSTPVPHVPPNLTTHGGASLAFTAHGMGYKVINPIDTHQAASSTMSNIGNNIGNVTTQANGKRPQEFIFEDQDTFKTGGYVQGNTYGGGGSRQSLNGSLYDALVQDFGKILEAYDNQTLDQRLLNRYAQGSGMNILDMFKVIHDQSSGKWLTGFDGSGHRAQFVATQGGNSTPAVNNIEAATSQLIQIVTDFFDANESKIKPYIKTRDLNTNKRIDPALARQQWIEMMASLMLTQAINGHAAPQNRTNPFPLVPN